MSSVWDRIERIETDKYVLINVKLTNDYKTYRFLKDFFKLMIITHLNKEIKEFPKNYTPFVVYSMVEKDLIGTVSIKRYRTYMYELCNLTILTDYRNKKHATNIVKLITSAIAYINDLKPNVSKLKIIATTHRDNIYAQRVFESSGYVREFEFEYKVPAVMYSVTVKVKNFDELPETIKVVKRPTVSEILDDIL